MPKSQSNRRRKREDDDDDDDDHQSIDLHEVLSTSKQRRTLIDQLQGRRGVDASDLLKKNSFVLEEKNSEKSVEIPTQSANPTASDALSSKTQLPTGGSVVAEEQKIWDRKHAAAMEEFVKERLKLAVSNNSSSSATLDPLAPTTNDDDVKLVIATKDQLYRELAAKAAILSGKNLPYTKTTDPNKIPGDNTQDVLTAGAATAIAEVILPVSDRLQAVKATAQAASIAGSATSSLPNARLNKSAIPSRFRASSNHHHPVVNQGGSGIGLGSNNSSVIESTVDNDRPGFKAGRQLQQQNTYRPSGGHFSQSTDDRVYQQFVKRQREQQSR